jgi:predicted peptidase
MSSLIVSLSLIVLLTSGTQAKPMLYEAGDWKTLWWYPKQAPAPVLGTQVKVEDAAPRIPHLVFVPAGVPPEGGWPVIVFLHGQGESSPSPLEGVALQGPPQHAGRHASSLPFAVISPQKPMGSQFFDDDVAAAIAATVRHYLATQPLDARRGPAPCLALAPCTDPGSLH